MCIAGTDGGTLTQVFEAYDRALAAAEKAVALAPGLADAHVARGRARVWARLDWAGGRDDLEHALALNPSDASALRYYAEDALLPRGLLAGAGATARKAAEPAPRSPESW